MTLRYQTRTPPHIHYFPLKYTTVKVNRELTGEQSLCILGRRSFHEAARDTPRL